MAHLALGRRTTVPDRSKQDCMTDLTQLKTDALARIEIASDAEGLEALRVEFLGKQGSISSLMKTLGKMSPDERKVEGPKIHGLRESVADALAARKDARAALDEKIETTFDAHLDGDRYRMKAHVRIGTGIA